MKRMALTLLLAFAAGGCNLLEWPMYVLFGQSQTKIKAEYTGLENRRRTGHHPLRPPHQSFKNPARYELCFEGHMELSRIHTDI